MTLALHWWRPFGNPRTAASEVLRHGSSWAHAARMGGSLQNFGDEASRVALEELSGQRIRHSRISAADVLGVGSILNKAWKARPDALVFGSGLRQLDHRPIAMPKARVLAVRGILTREALQLDSHVPLGDPALVMGAVYGQGGRTRASAPLFIPHFTMLSDRIGRGLLSALRSHGWEIQLPTTTPKLVAEKVRRAPLVATNSLHGIVFAHAFGVPVTAVDVAGHAEPRFKYDDYMSAFGLRYEPVALELVVKKPLDELVHQAAIHADLVSVKLPTVVNKLNRAASPLRSTT